MPDLSNQQLPNVPPFNSNGEKITVAVFDTGIDPVITNTFTSDVESCQPGGKRGWNFARNNVTTTDDHNGRHGTVVSKFIIDQLRLNPGGNRINLLPVKIFQADGSSYLFDVLCGFAYAQKAGAKIINASFGFYYYEREPPKILYEYVNRVLTANKILLVAAAGNRDEVEDRTAARCLRISGEQLRNQDYHYFYPGGLAKYLPNVFCVTTASDVRDPSTSPSQNFSNNVVDIGVEADNPVTYSFYHPFNITRIEIVKGSSFAAPVFT